jgi:hypothetical protein
MSRVFYGVYNMGKTEIIRLLAIHAAMTSPIDFDVEADAKSYELIFSRYLASQKTDPSPYAYYPPSSSHDSQLPQSSP